MGCRWIIHLVLFSERKCNPWCSRGLHLDVTVTGNEVTHRGIVVINEVEVDPQLPHALESIFKSETETNNTLK